jgi:hypothetical protein
MSTQMSTRQGMCTGPGFPENNPLFIRSTGGTWCVASVGDPGFAGWKGEIPACDDALGR